MIRYRDRIDIRTNRTGNVQISTDAGSHYLTSAVTARQSTPRTQWWERQNRSELREWQKDVLLGEVGRLYTRINFSYEMHYYLVYQEGGGFNQPHDVVFARIPMANTWILGTAQHSWIYHSELDNFSLYPSQSVLGDIMNPQARKQYYEHVLEPIEAHVNSLR